MYLKHGQSSQQSGKSKSPEYHAWANAYQRCHNTKDPQYNSYGGRGIKMYEGWIGNFQAFFEYMGKKPEKTTLDRIDNSKGYEPGNVRWATATEQFFNRRNCFRTLEDYKKYYEMHQQGLSFRKIGEILGISYGVVGTAIKRYRKHLEELNGQISR